MERQLFTPIRMRL